MTITACLVTRNHDRSIAQALRSVAGVATEVVVADTGSTDRTTELAAGLGARVIPVDWADDFSAVSNQAVAAATGDWVLFLNPDEELAADTRPYLTAAAADPGAFAWHLRVRQVVDPRRPEVGTSGRELRLFRRDPAVRYAGRLHPVFATPPEKIAADRGRFVGVSEATLLRHAYLSTPTPDKVRWVVRLLEAELRDRPGQVGFLIELGRNLLWLNDPRGHEVLGEAAGLVAKAKDAPAPPSPWVGSLVEYLLTVSPEQSRSPLTRDDARALGARWFPNTPPVVWALAAERFAAGDHAAAAGLLERLVRMGSTGEYDNAGGFAPEIVGADALKNLGLCYLHLGRWEEAKACFVRLLDDPRHGPAAHEGMHLAARRQKPAG